MTPPANLVNLERVSVSFGVRPILDEVSIGVGAGQRVGVVGRNGDGKSTLLDILGGQLEPVRAAGSPAPTVCGSVSWASATTSPPARASPRWSSVAAPSTSGLPTAPRATWSSLLLADVAPGPARRRALRRGAPPLLPGAAAARRARPAAARRAHQPPRRGGGRLARRPPGLPRRGAGRGDPRPLVPRRGVQPDVGGPRRRCRRLRRRLRRLRAGPRRARPAGGGLRGAATQPGAQGAGLAAARCAGAHLEAEVPHRRRHLADRRRPPAARLPGAAALRRAAPGQGRDRRGGRRPGAR